MPFLLIGLEVLVLRFQPISLPMAERALPIVLVARTAAVSVATAAVPAQWRGAPCATTRGYGSGSRATQSS